MDRGWSWRSEPEADSQSFVFVPKEYFVVKRRSRARFVDGGPFEARRAAPGAINCPPHTHTEAVRSPSQRLGSRGVSRHYRRPDTLSGFVLDRVPGGPWLKRTSRAQPSCPHSVWDSLPTRASGPRRPSRSAVPVYLPHCLPAPPTGGLVGAGTCPRCLLWVSSTCPALCPALRSAQ